MLNCRSKGRFKDSDVQVLIKFMKITFGLETITIKESEAVQLYSALVKGFKDKEPLDDL